MPRELSSDTEKSYWWLWYLPWASDADIARVTGLNVKGGEKVYYPHDEKELNWEPGGVRSGAGVRKSGLSQESSGSSETW